MLSNEIKALNVEIISTPPPMAYIWGGGADNPQKIARTCPALSKGKMSFLKNL